jgi:hypothetical protein
MTSNSRNVQPSPEPDVQHLRKDIGRHERRLEDVSKQVAAERAHVAGVPMCIDEQKIRWLIDTRRLRREQLGGDLVADPAWSILLELFAVEFAHRRVSVAELCKASGVPVSTAQRWINKQEEDHWLVRRGNPVQEQEQWAGLSARGSMKLRRHFEAVWRALPTA